MEFEKVLWVEDFGEMLGRNSLEPLGPDCDGRSWIFSISSQLVLLFAYIWQARGFQNGSLWREKQMKESNLKSKATIIVYVLSLKIDTKAAIQVLLEMEP